MSDSIQPAHTPEMAGVAVPPVIPPPLPAQRDERLAPIASTERMETLDVLRGFALFGILLVNMALFSWPLYDVMTRSVAWTGRADVIADWVVRFLAEGKFYALFSLLFGLGMTVQMERAEATGRSFPGLFCRRLLVLLGIGLVHAFFVWEGDILTSYALCGFLLLAFRKRKPKTLLIWAAICLLLPFLIYSAIWALISLVSMIPEVSKSLNEEFAKAAQEYVRLSEENLRNFRDGNWVQVFFQRSRNLMAMWVFAWFYLPMLFGMFLLGVFAGRTRVFQELESKLTFVRRVLIWGLCVGLPANLVYTIACDRADSSGIDLASLIMMAALAVGGPALCLSYATTITLLLRHERWKRRLRPLAAAGRMALSNYLFQSLVCTTVFYGYGFGLFGSVGRLAGLGLAVVIFGLQLWLSGLWLRSFRFGPVEWLWRTLTYGKRQPMRVRNSRVHFQNH